MDVIQTKIGSARSEWKTLTKGLREVKGPPIKAPRLKVVLCGGGRRRPSVIGKETPSTCHKLVI